MPSSSADRTRGGRALPWGVVAALVLLFCFRAYRTFRVFNDTADEAFHICCGLEVWERGQYTIEPQHPPLARALIALPAYLGGLRCPQAPELWLPGHVEFYWRTLSLARLGNLTWAPVLIVYVFVWARQIYGTTAGLAAAAVTSFCPNLLAHASLATLDFAAATTVFVAVYYLWRWREEPRMHRCVMAGVACAIAALTKFSALLFLPVLAAVFFGIGWRGKTPGWSSALKQGGLFVAVAALVIWGGYLFNVGPLGEPQFHPPSGSLASKLDLGAARIFAGRSLPAPQFWRGVLDVAGHNAEGHPSYLLGQLGQFGWWYYFPVALAVKTTLPLLLLVVLWVGSRFVYGMRRAELYPAAAAAVLFGLSMTSHINLGIRHVLALFPFFALVASGLLRFDRRSVFTAIAAVLAIWHAGESLAAHPDYLPYFNEIGRGREERLLLDSALDWGQDLERLRQYLEANQISHIHLSYFGRAKPEILGMMGAKLWGPGERPRGWAAISKAHIPGLGLYGPDFLWLRAYTPKAQVGKSILVYYFE